MSSQLFLSSFSIELNQQIFHHFHPIANVPFPMPSGSTLTTSRVIHRRVPSVRPLLLPNPVRECQFNLASPNVGFGQKCNHLELPPKLCRRDLTMRSQQLDSILSVAGSQNRDMIMLARVADVQKTVFTTDFFANRDWNTSRGGNDEPFVCVIIYS